MHRCPECHQHHGYGGCDGFTLFGELTREPITRGFEMPERTPTYSMLERQRDALLKACESSLPWVALATAGGDPYRHPQSLENAKEDLARIKAAIAEVKP